MTIIPYPEGVSDCTGRSTTFATGVWKDLYEYDQKYKTEEWTDNFFTNVQPVIVLGNHYYINYYNYITIKANEGTVIISICSYRC